MLKSENLIERHCHIICLPISISINLYILIKSVRIFLILCEIHISLNFSPVSGQAFIFAKIFPLRALQHATEDETTATANKVSKIS